MPVTLIGRLTAGAVMIAGVAVLGGVTAGVALIVARTVAATEEHALEVPPEGAPTDDQLPRFQLAMAGPASPRTRSRTFQRNTAHCTTAHPLTATATALTIGPTGLIRWK